MIFQFIRTDQLNRWLRANAPTVVANNPNMTSRDLWRAYLRSLSAVGSTWRDLENSYLTQAGDATAHKLRTRYAVFAGNAKDTGIGQKLRDKFPA